MPRRNRCVLPEVPCHITRRGVNWCETFSQGTRLFAPLLVFLIGISPFASAIGQDNASGSPSSRTDQIVQTDQRSPADCTSSTGNNAARRYDVIVIGAGIAGISATRELQHLGHSVLMLEANNRIGGRAYVGYIGDDKVPIDYGGAWLHGIATNPLTGMVDAMGFQRERTQLDLPYFVNGNEASEKEKEVFDEAVSEYEKGVELAGTSVEDQYALSEFACSEYKDLRQKHVPLKEICRDLGSRIPFSKSSFFNVIAGSAFARPSNSAPWQTKICALPATWRQTTNLVSGNSKTSSLC